MASVEFVLETIRHKCKGQDGGPIGCVGSNRSVDWYTDSRDQRIKFCPNCGVELPNKLALPAKLEYS